MFPVNEMRKIGLKPFVTAKNRKVDKNPVGMRKRERIEKIFVVCEILIKKEIQRRIDFGTARLEAMKEWLCGSQCSESLCRRSANGIEVVGENEILNSAILKEEKTICQKLLGKIIVANNKGVEIKICQNGLQKKR